MIIAGKHKAKAESFAFGKSGNGKEQVAVQFAFVGGENDGSRITWYGFFTDDTTDRTLDSLTYAGWNGDDFVNLPGLGSTEVELDVAEEEYQGKTQVKVRWVNRIGVALKDQMNAQELNAFAAKMRGKIAAHRQKSGTTAQPNGNRRQAGNSHASSQGGFYGPPPSDGDAY